MHTSDFLPLTSWMLICYENIVVKIFHAVEWNIRLSLLALNGYARNEIDARSVRKSLMSINRQAVMAPRKAVLIFAVFERTFQSDLYSSKGTTREESVNLENSRGC